MTAATSTNTLYTRGSMRRGDVREVRNNCFIHHPIIHHPHCYVHHNSYAAAAASGGAGVSDEDDDEPDPAYATGKR